VKTVFLRALEAEDKATALLAAIRERSGGDHVRFEVDPREFTDVPRSPFAYWVSEGLRHLFSCLPPFESSERTVKQGLATADDFRFVRAWWEVATHELGHRWFLFIKGGAFSPFYADVHLVVNWKAGGCELYQANGIPFGSAGAPIRNPNFYFRPGLTWPLRGSTLSVQVVPAECVFSIAGKMAFAREAELPLLLTLL
jgi:hypothetical protein